MAGKTTQNLGGCICGAEEISLWKTDKVCAAVALTAGKEKIKNREAHAAFVAGCAGYSKASCHTKLYVKVQL